MKYLHFILLSLFLGLIPVSAQQTVVYVNQSSTNEPEDGQSWATAYHELSTAANGGFLGDDIQVWIATGTYKPTAGTDRTASFTLGDDVALIGGFVGTETSPDQRYFRLNGQPLYPTVLSGDIGRPQSNPITATNSVGDLVNYYMNANEPGFEDNSLHVITATGRSGVVLDGLTITGGNASVSTNEVSSLLFMEMTQPTSGNAYGAALLPVDSRVAGGGLLFEGDDVGFAGAFYDTVYGGAAPNLVITNCIFVGNSAGAFGGAVAVDTAEARIDNTQFLQNQAGYEGGAFWGQSQMDNFSHCYFQYNWAYKSGGAVQLETIPNGWSVAGGDNWLYGDVSNTLASVQNYMANMEFTYEVMLGKLSYYSELSGGSSGPVDFANNHVAIEQDLENAGESLGVSILTAVAKQTIASDIYASFVDLVGANAADIIGVYGQMAAIVVVADIVVDAISLIPGIENLPGYDAFLDGWNMDYNYFETYASPSGWATLLYNYVAALEAPPAPSYESQAQALRVADQLNYNQLGFNQTFGPESYYQARTAFTFCQFETNQTEGCGGAIMAEYDNVTMEDCRFDHNRATLTGGAAMFTCFCQPILVSDAFVRNESVNGISAVANEFRVEPQILNCSFLDNVSATNGCAVDNELGADTFIGNSIFWGNSNLVTLLNGDQFYRDGADISTSTSSTLSGKGLDSYNQAGDSHWAWIGMCDVHYSLIQSETEIVLGQDDFENYNYGVDQLGALVQAEVFNVGQGMRETLTNRAFGNTAQNPAISGDGVAPSFGSPALNAGDVSLLNNGYRNWSITGKDLYGNPRVDNGKVDMGAVEVSGAGLASGYNPFTSSLTASLSNYSATSFNPFTSNLVAAVSNYVPPAPPPAEGPISNYYINASTYPPGDGSSWDKAYTNFPAIPTNLVANGTVWVAAGTYKPTVPMTVQSGMSVVGGVPEGSFLITDSNPQEYPTIIDGGGNKSRLLIAYTTNQPILVTGLTFQNGAQGNDNATALLEAYGSTIVSNCQFNNNLGASAVGENSLFLNCTFNNNQANGNSLGILVLFDSEAQSCSFTGNNSLPVYVSGGGISGCFFESNKTNSTSPFSGASIYSSELSDCNFQYQSGPSLNAAGGSTVYACAFKDQGVCASLQDSVITNCQFTQDALGPNDSAVMILSSSLAEDCQFTRNSGLQALATTNSSLNGCLFASNAPVSSGGVSCLNLNNGSAINCTFAGDGGTVAVAGAPSSGSVTFYGCEFVGNTNGASLMSTAPILAIGNCLFATNSSTNTSVVDIASGTITTIYDSEFFRNSGAGVGGAVYAGATELALYNCTIVSNTLTGAPGMGSAGVNFTGNSNCQVMNSILVGNSLTSPGGLSVEYQQFRGLTSAARGLVQNSIVQGLTLLPQSGSFDANPEFANPSIGNLTLSNNSPAINTGTLIGYPIALSSTDVAGNPRVVNGAIDIGAYEHPAIMGYQSHVTTSYSYSEFCDGLPSFEITASISAGSLPSGYYQWQVNRLDGNGFVPLANDAMTSGVNSPTITLTHPPTSSGQYLYRIISNPNMGEVIIPSNFVLPPFHSIIYVNQNVTGGAGDGTSWANAMTSLTTAVNSAISCGQIWVAQGSYTAPAGGFIPFNGVQIYGGFSGSESDLSQRNWAANPTYLQSSTTPVIVAEQGTTSATVIDGFYIHYTGHQEAVSLQSTPILQNCIFSNCTALAIVVEEVNSTNQVLISQCQFLNGSDTAILNNLGNLLVQRCLFSGNKSASGPGAILAYGHNGTLAKITDCQFYNNKGQSAGAIDALDSSATTVLRCAFTNNVGNFGGAIFVESGAHMVLGSSLLAGNQSTFDGGGIFYSGSSLDVDFCTIADNIAPGQGGGLYLAAPGCTVESSILWNNKGGPSVFAAQLDNQSSSSSGYNVNNTIIQGAPITTLNPYPYDPLFLSEPLGNYQLNTNSPAINIGTYITGALNADSADLLGNPRPGPGRGTDLGCYELTGAPAQSGIYLIAEPTNLTTCPISAASFSIIGSPGFPNYYQWQQFNGTSFVNINSAPQTQILAEQNTNVLFIPNAGSFNGSVFRVSVNNGAYITQPVTLTAPQEPVVYVNAAAGAGGNGTSWASAYQSLVAAVEATSCAQIWVAAGTYVGGEDLQLNSTVQILGGFNGSETLLSQRNYSNNVTTITADSSGYAFVAYNNVSNSALLDGFYVTGAPTGFLALNGQPTIQNCFFVSNAIAVNSEFSSGLQLSNCVFAGNSGSETIIAQYSTNLGLTGCEFTGNTGYLFLADQTSANLTNCQFVNNPGAEAMESSSSAITLERCQFSSNGPAINAYNGSVTMLDSLVSGNQTYNANVLSTAIFGSDTAMLFVNDTIADNFGAQNGEGVFLEGGSLNAYNCIFWGNASASPYYTTEQVQVYGADAGVYINHSLVQGLDILQDWTRDDISYAPLFVNEPAGNYQLAPVSPAIGSGSQGNVAGNDTDFLGNPRVHGGVVDMGAYAFAGTASTPAYLAYNFSPEDVCLGSSAVFSVNNLGAGSMTVAWLVNTGGGFGPVPAAGPYSISAPGNGSTLTVSNLNEAFNGTQFEFVLSGSVEYTSAPVTVTVSQQTVVYVDENATGANNGTSWADAFTSLLSAIEQAGPCTAIYVAQGTYTFNQSADLTAGVQIEGGFPTGGGAVGSRNPALYPTLVQVNPNYTLGAVFNQSYAEPPGQHTIVDGLVFPGTRTESAFNCTAGSPQVLNCVISNFPNLALANFQASMFVSNCVLVGNQTAFYGLQSDLQLSHCVISNSTESSVVAIGSQLTAADCRFVNNTNYGNGGAIALDSFQYFSGSAATVQRCVFTGNSAGDGGGAIFLDTYCSLNLMDSLLYGNSTPQNGGAIDNGGQFTAINCTFANNVSPYGAGAFYSEYAYATLENCIIWDTYVGTGVPYGTVSANYCNFEFQPIGGNSFTANPFFANAAAGDFTLSSRSPAIDGGNNAYVQSGDTDLAGNPRVQDGTVDLGAFESPLARNAVLVAAEPQATNVCVADPAQFQVVGGSTNVYQWQYNLGLGWTDITNGGTIAGSTVSISTNLTGGDSVGTFSIPLLTTNLNGLSVQAIFVGQSYTSTVATLTVPTNTIIYVDASAAAGGNGTSWTHAYRSLVDAIDTASACQPEIHVASGTYGASSTFAGTYSGYHDIFIPDGLLIYGGFPTGGGAMSARDWNANPTILTNAAGHPVVQVDGQYNNSLDGEATVLDGFIVEGNGISSSGVQIVGTSTTLRNLIVRDCAGSGVTAQLSSSQFTNCAIVNNQTAGNGGGVSLIESPVTLVNCVVRGNIAGGQGGGLSLIESGATLINSAVQGNSAGGNGGGVYTQNQGYYEAGYYNVIVGPDQLDDVLLTGNRASKGGGLYADGQATAVNSTISGNYATAAGGGVVEGGLFTLTMVNSVVWGNRSDPTNVATALTEEQQQVASDYTNNYANLFALDNDDIEGLHILGGGALVNKDPIFMAPLDAGSAPSTNGNFQLAGCSPLFGLGNAGYDLAISVDLTGQPRLTGGHVDLGPYQVGSGSATPLLITAEPLSLVYASDATNTFSVVATGDGLTYQWELAAPGAAFAPVANSATYSGATSATLELTQPPLNLNGALARCVITTSEGCVAVSQEAALKVYPTRYYVNANMPDDSGDGQTWATAFKTITHALSLPCDPSGTEIWCEAGAYKGGTLHTGQLLYGGFNGTETNLLQRNWTTNLTVLNPTGSYSPNNPLAAVIFSLPVTSFNAVAGAAVTPLSLGRIDGFQMSGANSAIVWTSGYNNEGATGAEEGATNVTVANCTFTNCDAAVYGTSSLTALTLTNDTFANTGISLQNASALVQNSVFTGANAGVNVQIGNVTISGSLFAGTETGVALLNVGSATITDSQFQSNATAISVQHGFTLLVQRSAFRGNTGGNAVVIGAQGYNPTATFEDSLFSGNAGAGAIDNSGTATFRNCTFAGNGGPGVTTYYPGQVGFALYNCIVWDNGAPNNKSASDPYFVSPVSPAGAPTISGDYHLTPCSPVIASGQVAQAGASTTDLEGLPRLSGGTVTPGAYEPQESTVLTISAQPTNVVAISGQTASFSANVSTTSGATFNWQVSIGGGAFTNLPNAGSYSGVSTTNLTFAASAAENGNAYRMQATYPSGCSIESGSATFSYIVPTLAESGTAPNTVFTQTGGLTISLPNGVNTSTINDQSVDAYGSESGRLSFGNGALALNGSTIYLNPNLGLHPGEQVFVTVGSSVLSSQGFPAIPQTWEFFNDVSSWDGAFSNALPINAASNYTANLVQAGDLNGDKSIDLFVSTSTGCRILTNNGTGSYLTNGISGTFSDSGQTLGSGAASKIVLGNVRGTGLLDAILLRNGNIEVWTNSDSGVFALASTYSASAADFALGDLNNDGLMDLFVLTPTNAQAWLNRGAGNFANAGISIPESNAVSVAVGDFNGDGKLDAYVVHGDSTAGHVWLNQGDATFELGSGAGLPSATGGYQRVVAGNFLNSGHLDLVAMTNGAAQIWGGKGDGSFTYYCSVAAENPNALCVGDINGDHYGDLAVAASGAAVMPEVSVYFQTNAGRQLLGNQGTIGNATAAAMADLNGDGALDLVLVSPSGQLEAAVYQPVNLWCQSGPVTDSFFEFSSDAFYNQAEINGAGMTGVIFDTVPTNGTLYFVYYGAITAGEEIDFDQYWGQIEFVYVPNYGFSGLDSFTWQAEDYGIYTGAHPYKFDISVAPQLNVVATNQFVSVAAGQSVSVLTNGANSILNGDQDYLNPLALTAVAESQPQHGTLQLYTDGTFTYTQNGGVAHSDSFNYFAQDRYSGVKSLSTVFITITNVNDTPQLITLASNGVYESQPIGSVAGYLAAQDSDPSVPGIAYSLVSGPGSTDNGSFAIVSNVLYTAASFSYADGATRSILVQAAGLPDAYNAVGSSSTQIILVNILPLPQALPQSLQAYENSNALTLTLTGAGVQPLRYIVVNQPTNGTLSGTPPNLSYLPDTNFFGTDTIGFEVTDGVMTSAIGQISITVNFVDQPPASANIAVSVLENIPTNFVLTATAFFTNEVLSYQLITNNLRGQLTGTPPNMTYTPTTNYHGADYFTYTASENGLTSAPVTVFFNVQYVEQAPAAVASTNSVPENGSIQMFLYGVDPEGSNMTVKIVSQPLRGAVSFAAPGGQNGAIYKYTPIENFNGTDSFAFVVNNGLYDSPPATVTMIVTPSPVPVALAQSVVTQEGQPVSITLTSSDATTNLGNLPATYRVVSSPAHGSLATQFSGSAAYVYSPGGGYFGLDSFSFVAYIGGFQSTTNTVTIDVQPAAPSAASFIVTNHDASLVGTVPIVFQGTDPNYLSLSYIIVTPPTNGFLATNFISDSAYVSYTPSNLTAYAPDYFTYMASDGYATSTVASVAIVGQEDPHSPEWTFGGTNSFVGIPITIPLSLLAFDPYSDPLVFVGASAFGGGSVTYSSNTITFTPTNPSVGESGFTFTVSNYSETVTGTNYVGIYPRQILVGAYGQINGQSPYYEPTLDSAIAFANSFGPGLQWLISVPIYPLDDTVGLTNAEAVAADGSFSAIDISGNICIAPIYVQPDEVGPTWPTNLILTAEESVRSSRLFQVDPGATLVLSNCVATGGSAALGGAIYSEGNLFLENSIVTNNTATSEGGAIYSLNGSVVLTNTEITANTAEYGGGLYQLGSGLSASLVASNSVISGNFATNDLVSTNANGGSASVTSTLLTVGTQTSPSFGMLAASYLANQGTVAKFPATADPAQFQFKVTPSAPWGDASVLHVAGVGSQRSLELSPAEAAAKSAQNISITLGNTNLSYTENFTLAFDPNAHPAPVTTPFYVMVLDLYYPVSIPVLQNVTGFSGSTLTVVSIGASQYGTTATDGTNIYYTAEEFFSSTDSFTYQVSDGVNTVTGLVYVSRGFYLDDSDISSGADSGAGSLRAEIDFRGSNYVAGGTQIALSTNLIIDLTSADDQVEGPSAFEIQQNVTIYGNGSTMQLDTNASPMRFFHVMPGASLTLVDLTLTGGIAAPSPYGEGDGGAIYNEGTVNLQNVTILNCQAQGETNSFALGGAIFNLGSVTLTNVYLTNNYALHGGGVYQWADGTAVSLETTNSIFSNPESDDDLSATATNSGTVSTLAIGSQFQNPALPWVGAEADFAANSTTEVPIFVGQGSGAVALTAVSENTNVIPSANLTFGGTGGVRQLTVTPSHNGIDKLDIQAALGGISFTRQFKISVNNVAPLTPVAPPEQYTVYGGLSSTLDVLTNDFDPGGATLSIVSASTPTNGSVIVTNNEILYVNDGGSATNDYFTYVVTNNLGGATIGAVSITVVPAVISVNSLYSQGEGTLSAALATLAGYGDSASNWTISISSSLAGQTLNYNQYGATGGDYRAFDITSHVHIDGSAAPGFTITIPAPGYEGPPMHIFRVEQAGFLELSGLTLLGGDSYNLGTPGAGFGGAIYNLGQISISNVTFKGNSVTGYGGKAAGGAVCNDGGVALFVNCLFKDNAVTDEPNSVGGAIFNRNGILTLVSNTFADNVADQAAGVCNFGEAITTITGSGPTGAVEQASLTMTGNTMTNSDGVTDVAEVSVNGGASEVVSVETNAINSLGAPFISTIPDETLPYLTYLPFSYAASGSATFSVFSSNLTIIPNANLSASGNGGSGVLRMIPGSVAGTDAIAAQVTDGPLSYAQVFQVSAAASGPFTTVQFTATPTNGTVPQLVSFQSPSVDSSNQTIAAWKWNFGDGTTSTLQNPTHTYTNIGSYAPSLLATNSLGELVVGFGPPNINLVYPTLQYAVSPTNGVTPALVQFTAPATDSGAVAIASWNWSFGDGSFSTQQSPTHIYTNAGSYALSLRATNVLGQFIICSGLATLPVLPPSVQYAAYPVSGVAPVNVQFVSPAADTGGNAIVSWTWDFGDGTGSVQQSPSHVYSAPGNYNVVLTLTNSGGLQIVATGPPIVYAGAPLTVLDYYRMGENDPGATAGGSSFTMFDSAGTNDLSVTGTAVYSTNVSPVAALLDGSSLSLNLGGESYGTNQNISPVANDFCLEAWVYMTNIYNNPVIIYYGDPGANGWGIGLINRQWYGLYGGVWFFSDGVNAALNQWTHVALVCNAGTSTIYVNGVPSGSCNCTPNPPSGTFVVGGGSAPVGGYLFDGLIDEVRLSTFPDGEFTTNSLLLNTPIAPTIAVAPVVTVGLTTATVTTTVNPNGLDSLAWISYGTTTNLGLNSAPTNVYAGTLSPFSIELSGLQQGASYYYAVVASNADGVVRGSISEFSMNIPPVAGTLFASGVTPTSATLNSLVYPKDSPTAVSFAWGTTTNLGNTNFVATLPAEYGGYDISNVLTGLEPGTLYFYTVIASNANGRAVGSIFNFTTAVAPVADTLFVSALTPSSAMLNCEVFPRNAATAVSFAWGTTTSLGQTNLVATLPAEYGGYDISNALSGLEPGTLYFYSVVASNANGISVGSIFSFTTPFAPVASTLLPTALASTSVTLNGEVYPRNAPTTVSFAWGTTTNLGNTNLVVALPAEYGGYSISNVLSGLQPGIIYFYSIVASNTNGTAVGSIFNFTTTVGPVADTLHATALTPSSAALNGEVFPRNAATAVSFAWGTTTNLGNTNLATTLPAEYSGYYISNVLTGLEPGTVYFYSVVATNTNGTAVGSIFNFTTPVGPAASTLYASNVTATSATFNGEVFPRNAPTTVSFVWGTTTNFGNTNEVTTLPAEYGGYFVSNVLSGLQPGAQYFYSVMATNTNGVAIGNIVRFSTIGGGITLGHGQILGAQFANGAFTIEFAGVAGWSYVLQATTNLTDWSSVSTNSLPQSVRYFSDPAATNFDRRYYRVVPAAKHQESQ